MHKSAVYIICINRINTKIHKYNNERVSRIQQAYTVNIIFDIYVKIIYIITIWYIRFCASQRRTACAKHGVKRSIVHLGARGKLPTSEKSLVCEIIRSEIYWGILILETTWRFGWIIEDGKILIKMNAFHIVSLPVPIFENLSLLDAIRRFLIDDDIFLSDVRTNFHGDDFWKLI